MEPTMRTRFLALTTSLCLLGPPAAAFAQVNYELLPGGYSLGKNGLTTFQQWNALVLSNKDGNAYACLARLPGGGTMSFTCNRLTFSGAFLRGPNVVSMHSAGNATSKYSESDSSFWQLDQQSGELQICHLDGGKPGATSISCLKGIASEVALRREARSLGRGRQPEINAELRGILGHF